MSTDVHKSWLCVDSNDIKTFFLHCLNYICKAASHTCNAFVGLRGGKPIYLPPHGI